MNAKAFLLGYMSKTAGPVSLPEAVAAQNQAQGDPKSADEITFNWPKRIVKAKGKPAVTLASDPTAVAAMGEGVPPPPQPPPPPPKDPNAPKQGTGSPVDLASDMSGLPPDLQQQPQMPEMQV